MSDPVFVYGEYRAEPHPQAPDLVALLAGEKLRETREPQQHLPQPGEEIVVDGAEGKHAAKVKRLAPGERFVLIDGYGHAARCEVKDVESKAALRARVIEALAPIRRHPQVIVVQALPKSERSELAVDLATQAGADAIVPWAASRCIAKWVGPKAQKGTAKWADAAYASAKQSRRADIPIISQPASTSEVCELIEAAGTRGGVSIVLHEAESSPLAALGPRLSEAAFVIVIVGPEGGISEDELTQLSQAGAVPVVLGPEVLRTASAAAVALGALGVLTSRWSSTLENK